MTTLNLRAIYACSLVAAKNDRTRPQLKGVYTHLNDQKMRVYVGADGKALIAIAEPMCENDNGESLIIPRHVIPYWKKSDRGELGYNPEAKLCSMATASNTFSFHAVDYNYLDYMRVMSFTPMPFAEIFALDVDYLATITKAYKHYSGKKTAFPWMTFESSSAPIKITFLGDSAFDARLMPIVMS